MYVYSYHVPHLNAIKIGHGADPRARMDNYAYTHNLDVDPRSLKMWNAGDSDNARAYEQRAHDQIGLKKMKFQRATELFSLDRLNYEQAAARLEHVLKVNQKGIDPKWSEVTTGKLILLAIRKLILMFILIVAGLTAVIIAFVTLTTDAPPATAESNTVTETAETVDDFYAGAPAFANRFNRYKFALLNCRPLSEAQKQSWKPEQVVKTLQYRLTRAGYDAGPIDGKEGPRTRSALKAFYADHEDSGSPIEDVSKVSCGVVSTADLPERLQIRIRRYGAPDFSG